MYGGKPLKVEKNVLFTALRQRNAASEKVLQVMESLPREDFIPFGMRIFAYDDSPLPIDNEQTISQPTIIAIMTEALKLKADMTVLEVGTGSGYQAAILSKLAAHIYSVERHAALSEQAAKRFKKLTLNNISLLVGDGSRGWKGHAPFDRIMVTAAADDIPKALKEQLVDGGIMVIPVETGMGGQVLKRLTKTGEKFKEEILDYVSFVPLISD